MNKKLNVLVLGVGGNVSQGIMVALRLSNIPMRIIGACVSHESLGLYYCDAAYISPYASNEAFIPWVMDVCNREQVDIVFSGVEEIIQCLEEHIDLLESENITFVSSPIDCLRIGNSKLKTCQWLKDNGLNYPQFAPTNDKSAVRSLIATIGYPLIAKPINGKGSSGVMVINSDIDVESVPLENYILQEYLGSINEEYTVGCYISMKGELSGMIVCKRSLKYGTTFKAEIVHNDLIEAECRKICGKFSAIGPLNIQLRMHNGKPVCFELNVRFSGTTPLRARWHFNDVEAMIREYIYQEEPHLIPDQQGLAYRYFNEAYIDLSMMSQLLKSGKVEDVKQYNSYKESL